MKYVADDKTRKVVELILSQQVFHRSFIAPPGTTPANLAILRRAFDATMKDPQFIADADKLRIDVAPLSGERVQEVVRNLYAASPDVVELARAAIK
jgi:tripartite-type tricarboxylate transporter receptor subunit TctC